MANITTTYTVQYRYSNGNRYFSFFKKTGRPVISDDVEHAVIFNDKAEAQRVAEECQRYTKDGRWVVAEKRTAAPTDEMRAKVAARMAERRRNR